jgi:5-methylthioadenosine/S-adenosylhomocysteine deaminase
MKPDLVISGGTLITMDRDRSIVENGTIHIKDGKIIYLGAEEQDSQQLLDCRRIDAKGKFIFPGFINTHTHIFQTLIRGFGQDLPVWNWFEKFLDPVVENLSVADAYVSAKLGSIEAIRSGTTTILDYNYPHPHPGMAEETIHAFQEVGIRGILARGIIDTGSVHKKIIHSTRDEMKACESLLKTYGDFTDRMISIWLAPYSIFSTSKEAFIQTKELADHYHAWISVHAATPSSIESALALYGVDDIAFEESIGFLGPNVLAVHCCADLPERTLNTMRDYGVKVSHNPVSNAYLGEGIAPIAEMVAKGIKVSLATDGPASNNNQDMVAVLKFAALLQKVSKLDPTALTAWKTLEMATIEGAECVGMDDCIGSLEPGKQADLILVDLNTAGTVAYADPVSSLVYSATQENIHTVLVNGRVIMEDRKIRTVDEGQTLDSARESGRKLAKRALST